MRIAMGNGLKLYSFCCVALKRITSWNRDVDKIAYPELVKIVAEKTATPFHRAWDTTLSSYEGLCYEKHNAYGNTVWILRAGIYHRTRRLFGQQYCPRCLREDREPYFRKSWRLAFITLCSKHNVLLLDRCPRCGSPVNFHRDEMGDRNKACAQSLVCCHKCAFDLRRSTVQTAKKIVTAVDAKNQNILLAGIEQRWVQLHNAQPIYCLSFFPVLHQLMRILNSRAKLRDCSNYLIAIPKKQKLQKRHLNKKREIEQLSPIERLHLLRAVFHLFDDWPNRFIDICLRFKIPSSELFRDFDNPPYWFWKPVRDHLYHPDYSPTDEEIRSVIRFMYRQNIPPTKRNISRFFGPTLYNIFRKRDKLTYIKATAFFYHLR